MKPRLYRPSPGQVHWLIAIGLGSVGWAIYVRYLALEHSPVSLACQDGLKTWLCATFRAVIPLFQNSVFGWVALVTALLNLIRPSIVLITVSVAAGGFGLVMHNANLAGLGMALLILSLARRAPGTASP